MYNRYEYNFTKDTGRYINLNLNLIDCFEKTDYEDNINELLDNINSKFLEGLKEAEKEKEKEKEKPYISSRISRYNKYSKSR